MANQALRKLYTANSDNEVVIFATNLKEFVTALKGLDSGAREYSYYFREFKKKSILNFKAADGREYKLQEVFNNE